MGRVSSKRKLVGGYLLMAAVGMSCVTLVLLQGANGHWLAAGLLLVAGARHSDQILATSGFIFLGTLVGGVIVPLVVASDRFDPNFSRRWLSAMPWQLVLIAALVWLGGLCRYLHSRYF